jgi:hypothetical protein
MREPTLRDYFYRLSRWLLKEAPITAKKVIIHKTGANTLLDTPIDLFCWQARAQGQQQTQLPEQARQIDWLLQQPYEASTKIHE